MIKIIISIFVVWVAIMSMGYAFLNSTTENRKTFAKLTAYSTLGAVVTAFVVFLLTHLF